MTNQNDEMLVVDNNNKFHYFSQNEDLSKGEFEGLLNTDYALDERTNEVLMQMKHFINSGEKKLHERGEYEYCPRTRYIVYVPSFKRILLFFGEYEFLSIKNLTDFSNGTDNGEGIGLDILCLLAKNDFLNERLCLKEYL